MDQQLSDARMRIVQLTAQVQSSKQAAQQHEDRTAALQAQVHDSWPHMDPLCHCLPCILSQQLLK